MVVNRLSRSVAGLRRHWPLLVLLTVGGLLRLAMMRAYRPAFWYFGDSSVYFAHAISHVPDSRSPYGYSFAIQLLRMLPVRPLELIPLLQHLAGLAVPAACYAYLRRGGVSRLVSVLAVAPVVLDARTIVVEHYVLSDTLFTTLTVTGLIVLTAKDRPGKLACAIAGLVLAAAGLTRTVGLPLLALPLSYIVVRSLGDRPAPFLTRLKPAAVRMAAFAVCVLVPVGGYMVWYHDTYDVYSLGTYRGRFLWARVSTFVECDKVPDLTVAERRLCPPQPLGRRLDPDLYLWNAGPNSELAAPEYDSLFAGFSRKVLRAQPVDYAWTVARDTWLFVRPGGYPTDRITCLANLWQVPKPDPRGPRLYSDYQPWLCQPTMSAGDLRAADRTVVASTRGGGLATGLHWYSRILTVPATVPALGFVLVVVSALVPRWRTTLRASSDSLLWAGFGMGIVVISVATSASDPRYGVPVLPLVLTGSALAWHRVRSAPQPPAPPAPDPSPGPLTRTDVVGDRGVDPRTSAV
ncbi:MAG: hypothetical protein QOG43_2785 [Actinomycetota bacterium]|nr:hypothetical protein [Actinomycetota bacterium]